jgi:hypothetical protein
MCFIHGRMPASSNPLAPDHDSDHVVELQSHNRCASTGGTSDNSCSVLAPHEMPRPTLTTRVKQANAATCRWIACVCLRSLVAIAHPAGESEVILIIRPASCLWDNMIDFERPQDVSL